MEQHEGVIGDSLDRGRQACERCGVRPRPRPGHGVLVHRPAERAQSPTVPPVIRVAAARPGRIVDAVRNDDMHRAHNGRS